MARILIVEDDKVIGAMLSDILTKYYKKGQEEGMIKAEHALHITQVESAIIALERLKEFNYELVITDILMVKFDGWQLIKEVRKTKTQSELPIFVVSAIDSVDLQYNSAKYGASGWMTKPVKPKEFSEKIFKLINGR